MSPSPPANNHRRSILLAGLFSGLVLILWLLLTPEGLLGKADAIGYAVCHRIDVRSFSIGDRPIALCARCTGQYLGVVITFLFLGITGGRKSGIPPLRVLIALGAMFTIWGLDGANSMLSMFPAFNNPYEPNNILRLITGTGFGMAVGTVVFVGFNQLIWRDAPEEPPLPGLKQTGMLVVFNLAGAGLILLENPMLLYPLTLISAGGVMAALSMIYAMMWVAFRRQDNQFNHWRETGVPLIAGFGLAMLQIALIDLARFWLTGTWDGFHVLL